MKFIKNIYYRYHKNIINIFTIFLLILNIVNIYFITNVVTNSNDECLWVYDKKSDKIIFDNVKVGGVTWDAGIRDGDTLISINDIKIKNTFTAQITLDAVPEGFYAKYEYERDGKVIQTKVYIKKLINFFMLSFAFMALCWLIVAFFVMLARNEGYTQRLFYRIAAALTFYSLSGGLLLSNVDVNPIISTSIFLPLSILAAVSTAYLPFFIVHFFWIFPSERKIMKYRYTKKILYAIPLLIFLLFFPLEIIYRDFHANFLGTILLIVSFIMGFISLILNYLKIEEKQKRNPILIILLSFALGIIAIFYVNFIADKIADTIFNSPEYYMPIILIIIIPISFGISIFKYSLLDVSDVLKKTLIYGFATVILGGLYFSIIYILGQSASSFFEAEYRGVIAAVFFIIFALGFQSSKNNLQEILTRKFYPEQFAFQKVLLKFGNDITTIVGLENIFEYVYKIFVKSLNLEKFAIVIFPKESSEGKIVKFRGIKENFTIKLYKQKIFILIRERKAQGLYAAIQREDFKEIFPEDSERLIEEGIYTIIPLVVKSRILGLLCFGLKYSGTQFVGKDLELLIAASNQITISIDNARLYETEAEQLKYKRDLENAKEIQESLLPKKIPYIKGLGITGIMVPAMQVGGDYYDVIKISDTKIFVVVGDVSGKGLAASFYMTKLQTMMRLFCSAERRPSEILKMINKEIFTSIEKNWFITMALGLFDLEEKTLKYSRAGHMPLIISEEKKIELIKSRGIGVGLEKGVLFDATLEEVTIPLKENQKFIFFSDGVNEAANPEGEFFGMEKFKEIVKETSENNVEDTLQKIMNEIQLHRQNAIHNDDVTLVLTKVNY